MKKIQFNHRCSKIFFTFFTLILVILLSLPNNCLADELITIKNLRQYNWAYPKIGTQPYKAFGYTKDTIASNITKQGDSISDVERAIAFVRIKMFPEHVGVFTSVRKQQFVAFGYKTDGSTVNITKKVDWMSSNERIVTINENGLATVVPGKTFGKVKITCSYPKQPKTPKGLTGPYHLLLRYKPEPPPKKLTGPYLLLLGE